MKNFKAYFKRDVSHASYTSRLASLPFALSLALSSFAGVGVTKKQLDRTVSEINSNMSAAVSAEIGRNVDSYVDEITLRAIAGATNFLPSFIEGLGQFAEASRFSLLEFDENSLVFDDSYMSNGVFVSRSRKAYFKAGWVCPTNKGFTVASSSYPGIPAGTVFAIDEVPIASTSHPMRVVGGTLNPINNGRLVWNRYQIHNADLFSKPLELLWCEWRYDIGVVETNRVISENGLYEAKISIDWPSSVGIYDTYKMEVTENRDGASANWVKPPSGEAHIVTLTDVGGIFRMAVVSSLETDGYILGTFTLVPTCLNDAEAHTARNGTPKVSALSRLWRSVKALFSPDAVAARYPEVFSADSGVPAFCITWTTESGETLGVTEIPISRTPPKKRVNDKGVEHDTDEMYLPCPWYTLADWRKVENWISFPTAYTIYYADSLGKYETGNGTRYSASNRQMNISTFKALFLGHDASLSSLYVYPRKVEKRDPCKEGRHSYVHCVCSVCGKQREHKFVSYGDCKRCGWEESVFTVDENNEIVEEPGSRTACGFVPDGEEYHGGWRGVGEVVDEAGNRQYCGCYCGHYADSNDRYFPRGYEGNRAGSGIMSLVIDHKFEEFDPENAGWTPGDENGNDEDNVHHARMQCSRKCGTTSVVVANHNFYKDDGTFNCEVIGINDDNYHQVVGRCLDCGHETATADLHRRQLPNEGNGAEPCVCIGGVNFDTEGCGEVHHHYVVTACGEVRCLYCLAYHDESPRLRDSEHRGVQPVASAGDMILLAGETIPIVGEPMKGAVLRAMSPNAEGHPCGCGLVMLPHNFINDPDTGESYCPDVRPPGLEYCWWASEGCGWVWGNPDEESGKYEATVSVNESRGGYSLKQRTYRISSFSWDPSKGEQPPSPSDIWGDGKNAPTSLPPLDGGIGELSPTVVDFTYLTEFSSEWSSDWVWKNGGWEKKRTSFWSTLKWWLLNTPVIFR